MFSQKKSFFKGKLFTLSSLDCLFWYLVKSRTGKSNLPNDVSTDIKYPVSTDDALSTESQDRDYNILDNIIGRKHKDT